MGSITLKVSIAALVFIVSLLRVLPAVSDPALQPHYRLDISDAEVSFSVKVLGLVTVRGQFLQVEGDMQFTDSCDTTDIVFRVQTASVTTGDRLIENMIRGPSLLDSERYPLITFNSSQVAGNGDGPQTITGELFLNGVRRSVSFEVTPDNGRLSYSGPAQRYLANTDISRRDFGIRSPMIGTSDRIRIQVSLLIHQGDLRLASADATDALR